MSDFGLKQRAMILILKPHKTSPYYFLVKVFFLCHKLTLGLRLRSLTNVLANNFDDLNQLNPLELDLDIVQNVSYPRSTSNAVLYTRGT